MQMALVSRVDSTALSAHHRYHVKEPFIGYLQWSIKCHVIIMTMMMMMMIIIIIIIIITRLINLQYAFFLHH